MPRESRTLTESRVKELIEDTIRQRLRAGFSRNLIDLLAVSAPVVIVNPDSPGSSIGLAFDDSFFSVDGSGQLTFDGAAVVSALSDLNDVDTTGVIDGQILSYNHAAGEWQPSDLPTIPANLSDLNDVHDAAPSDDDVLTWNAGESRWEPAAPTGGGASELSDLSDVDTTGVTDGQILTFNNTAGEWQPDDLPSAGDTIVPLGTQVFTEDGSYTPNANVVYITVEIVGGGGGGGGAGSNETSGAGGGGGGYALRRLLVTDLPTPPISIVVGVGGIGGSVGANSGSSGGTTAFGSLMSATGGEGGEHGTGIVGDTPGGVGSGGDVNFSGGPGATRNMDLARATGVGGSSQYGFGAPSSARVANLSGSSGQGFGGGGSGGLRISVNASGGDGSDGVVLIHEFGTV